MGHACRDFRGGGWRTEKHGFDSLPLYARDGAVIPVGARDDVPDYDYLDKLTLRVFPSSNEGEQTVTVTDHASGDKIRFRVERSGERVEVSSDGPRPWALDVVQAPGAP